jgi:hypothetical protein
MHFKSYLFLFLLPKVIESAVKIGYNGQRYVFVADFGARHCQATMKFEASYNLSN